MFERERERERERGGKKNVFSFSIWDAKNFGV